MYLISLFSPFFQCLCFCRRSIHHQPICEGYCGGDPVDQTLGIFSGRPGRCSLRHFSSSYHPTSEKGRGKGIPDRRPLFLYLQKTPGRDVIAIRTFHFFYSLFLKRAKKCSLSFSHEGLRRHSSRAILRDFFKSSSKIASILEAKEASRIPIFPSSL